MPRVLWGLSTSGCYVCHRTLSKLWTVWVGSGIWSGCYTGPFIYSLLGLWKPVCFEQSPLWRRTHLFQEAANFLFRQTECIHRFLQQVVKASIVTILKDEYLVLRPCLWRRRTYECNAVLYLADRCAPCWVMTSINLKRITLPPEADPSSDRSSLALPPCCVFKTPRHYMYYQ